MRTCFTTVPPLPHFVPLQKLEFKSSPNGYYVTSPAHPVRLMGTDCGGRGKDEAAIFNPANLKADATRPSDTNLGIRPTGLTTKPTTS